MHTLPEHPGKLQPGTVVEAYVVEVLLVLLVLLTLLASCGGPMDSGLGPARHDSTPPFTTGPSPASPGACLLGEPPSKLAMETSTASLQLSADPPEELLHGRYRSHVYRLDYEHEGSAHHNYFRLDLPCLPAGHPTPARLAVLLVVEGGGGQSQALAVRADPTQEAEYRTVSLLASGANGDSWHRPGPPMVVITPTLPGRGFEKEGLAASGAMEIPREGFPWHTPANGTGQDYGGPLTIAALDAVVASAGAALDALRDEDDTGALVAMPERWLLFSTSNGLASAARWLAGTEQPVHALVDFEGTVDSLEQTKGSWSIDPFGLSGLELPVDPSFAAWAEQFEQGIDLYYFRPPREILPQLPADESLFAASELPEKAPGSWARWYGPGAYDPEELTTGQDAFWHERDASSWLTAAAGTGCAHLRLQSSEDHAQPSWLMQRHAVRAMNASLEGGAPVFFTDRDGYEAAMIAGHEAEPAPWGQVQALDDWPSWGSAWAAQGMDWSHKVDLVRWAAAQELGDAS